MKNFIAILLSITLCAVMLGYTIFWHAMAARLNNESIRILADARASGWEIEDGFAKATGFPGRHELQFTGTITYKGIKVLVPELHLRAFPLPGQILTIYLPQGARIEDPNDLWSIDYLEAEGPIPAHLPADITVESLRDWRDSGGGLDIHSVILRKNALAISGAGRLTLDDSLQPAGTMAVRVGGYNAFLGYLQQKNMIDGKEALIAGTVLNGLSQPDPQTGERAVGADLTLQGSSLFLGPLPLFDLPAINWPYAAGLSRAENFQMQNFE